LRKKRKLVEASKLRRRPNDLVVFQTRLIHKVDEMLRRRIRRHGDMSLFVKRSLEEIDLRSVEIGRFHGKKVLSTTKATQVVMPVSLRKKLQEIAPERGCSMNELLNSAVLAWLRKGRLARAGAAKRQPAYDLMSPEERNRLWQSLVSLTGVESGPRSPSREGGYYEWDSKAKSVLEVAPSGRRYAVSSRGGELVRIREIGRAHFVEGSRAGA
jgi:hypothetical protein